MSQGEAAFRTPKQITATIFYPISLHPLRGLLDPSLRRNDSNRLFIHMDFDWVYMTTVLDMSILV